MAARFGGMTYPAMPKTQAEAKALFDYYRATPQARVPWYAVVYLPPELQVRYRGYYDALVKGFEELQENDALSQSLFRSLLDPSHQSEPVRVVMAPDHPGPLVSSLEQSPLAYMPANGITPYRLRHTLLVHPETFRRIFADKEASRIAMVVEDGIWPLSSVLAHELTHAADTGSVGQKTAPTAVQMIAERACYEAKAIDVENVQRAFLGKAHPQDYGAIQPRTSYVNMRSFVDNVVTALKGDAQERQKLAAQGLEHPIMGALILRGMLNAGCGPEAEARKDAIIRGAIDEVARRLDITITVPDSPSWMDTSVPSRADASPAFTPPVTPAVPASSRTSVPAR